MSKSLVGVFLLLVCFATAGQAATIAHCPPATVAPSAHALQSALRQASDHGYLWRITKDERTSYLYGTIHVATLDWAFPGPTVMQAIRATDTLALELDVGDPDIQQRMASLVAQIHKSALNKGLQQRLNKTAKALCAADASFGTLAPELQVLTLGIMEARLEGLDPAFGIDAVLAGVGHGANKTVVSLETPELQVGLLEVRDPAKLRAFVEISLDGFARGRNRKMLRRLAKDWGESAYDDIAQFDRWCECFDTEIEREMMKKMLDERNPNLANSIDQIHTNGQQVFVAVGTLHMFGPLGLPRLMAEKGYRVERLLPPEGREPKGSADN